MFQIAIMTTSGGNDKKKQYYMQEIDYKGQNTGHQNVIVSLSDVEFVNELDKRFVFDLPC